MNKLSVTGKANLNIPALTVITFLHNLHHISQYEPKLKSTSLMPDTPQQGFYETKRTFLELPWSGKFSYELNDRGFHSEMVNGLLANKMCGGFIVNSEQENTCSITHYENCQFPKWTRIINPILKQYLRQSMVKELKAISRLICVENKIPENKLLDNLCVK